MGGPGSMMLPPPTPFSGTSGTGTGAGTGTGTGFLDPSTLSTSALPLGSGESPFAKLRYLLDLELDRLKR